MNDARTPILVINGHPDAAPTHLCAALAEAYAEGARAAGHEVERLDVGPLDFPVIRSPKDYHGSPIPADITPKNRLLLAEPERGSEA